MVEYGGITDDIVLAVYLSNSTVVVIQTMNLLKHRSKQNNINLVLSYRC